MSEENYILRRWASFECPECFLIWQESNSSPVLMDSGLVEKTRLVEKKCEYCETQAYGPRSLKRLQRRLEVMDKALPSRMPDILRDMYDHMAIKEEDY